MDALTAALSELDLLPQDQALVALASQYATALDTSGTNPDGLIDLGPKYLAVLEALLMTPRSRAAALKGGRGDNTGGKSRLAEQRERRAARLAAAATAGDGPDGTTDLDAAPPGADAVD